MYIIISVHIQNINYKYLLKHINLYVQIGFLTNPPTPPPIKFISDRNL